MEDADLRNRIQKRRGGSFMSRVPEVTQVPSSLQKKEVKVLAKTEPVTAVAVPPLNMAPIAKKILPVEPKEEKAITTSEDNKTTIMKGFIVGVDESGSIVLKTIGEPTSLEFIGLADYAYLKSQDILKKAIDTDSKKIDSILKGVTSTASGVVALLHAINPSKE